MVNQLTQTSAGVVNNVGSPSGLEYIALLLVLVQKRADHNSNSREEKRKDHGVAVEAGQGEAEHRNRELHQQPHGL